MAKSLRSKWRRKCRAVKRIKYGQRELEVLKKTLGIDTTNDNADVSKISHIGQVVPVREVKRTSRDIQCDLDINDDKMDTKSARIFNSHTMKDQNGAYPIWMHQRKIKKGKQASKVMKKQKIKNR